MYEIEIKLAVPPDQRDRVVARLRRSATQRTRLQAVYFDTPDHRLADALIALRLRKEGRRWMQTAKAAGDNPAQRLEHNAPRQGAAGAPPRLPDPALHQGTPVGKRLAQALGEPVSRATLRAQYSADIWRTQRLLKAGSARLELAFDEGTIAAGALGGKGASVAVCELEIECIGGPSLAVLDVAEQWIERHGLWLDWRSKALRGERLARPALERADAPARLRADPEMTVARAWLELNRACMPTVFEAASDVAAGSAGAADIHRLRIALTRLRMVWRLFRGTPFAPPAALEQYVHQLFRALGRVRDLQVCARLVQEQCATRPTPWVAQWLEQESALHAQADPSAWLRDSGLNRAWLSWLRLCWDEPGAAALADAGERFGPWMGRQLGQWHRRALKRAARFGQADDARRHELRKGLKRFRYALEMLTPLLPAKALDRLVRRVRRCEKSLGRLNDLSVCRQLVERSREPGAPPWLLARLAAEHARTLGRCLDDLDRLARTPTAALWAALKAR